MGTKTLKLYRKKKYKRNHPTVNEIIKNDSFERVAFRLRFPKDEYIDGRPAYLFGDGMLIEEFKVKNGNIIHSGKAIVSGKEPVCEIERWIEISADGTKTKGMILVGEKELKETNE